MKVLLSALAAVLALSVSAQAATTLEFDVTGVTYKNNREVKLNIPKLNKTLNEAGLDGLPEQISVGKNAGAYGKVLQKRIEAAQEALGERFFMPIDNGYLHNYPPVCYRGNASDVPAILNAMVGTFMYVDQGILAMRYGTKTIIEDDTFKSEKKLNETYEGGNAETRAWLRFNTASKNVLVMTNLGPEGDGTELYATVIKPCK